MAKEESAAAEAAVAKSKFAIAYFSSQISAVENKDLELQSQQDPDNEKRKTFTCKTANGIQWVGRRDASLLRTTRLVLLARDRLTGQVSVVATSAEAYRFLPACVLDAADTDPPGSKRKRPASMAPPATPQQRATTAVYEEFGSTAKKRRIAEAKRLNASVSAHDLKVAAATATKRLGRATADGGGTPAAAAAAASHASAADQLLPARDSRGFFAPDALCPPRLRAALLPEAERLAASGVDQWAAWEADTVYSDALILRRLRTAPADPAARLGYCVRLAMLACMRRFYALNSRAVNRKGALPGLPEDVGSYLLDCYTEKVTTSTGQHRALTHHAKDKQLLHMILLCLVVDGYSTETAGLMAEFRLASGRLQKLLKVIGCEVVKEKSGSKDCQIARLKAAPTG